MDNINPFSQQDVEKLVLYKKLEQVFQNKYSDNFRKSVMQALLGEESLHVVERRLENLIKAGGLSGQATEEQLLSVLVEELLPMQNISGQLSSEKYIHLEIEQPDIYQLLELIKGGLEDMVLEGMDSAEAVIIMNNAIEVALRKGQDDNGQKELISLLDDIF